MYFLKHLQFSHSCILKKVKIDRQTIKQSYIGNYYPLFYALHSNVYIHHAVVHTLLIER